MFSFWYEGRKCSNYLIINFNIRRIVAIFIKTYHLRSYLVSTKNKIKLKISNSGFLAYFLYFYGHQNLYIA